MCPRYMCIFQYVKLIWCSAVPEIYGQLDKRGICSQGIYAFANMSNLFGVVVFQTSLVHWRGYICPKYMCILLYVKLFQCNVFYRSMVNWKRGALVYMKSAICETSLV